MASEIFGPSVAASARSRSRASSSRLFCSAASIVSRNSCAAGDLRDRLHRRHAAPASASDGAPPAPARIWRARSRRPAPARRGKAVEHTVARRARRLGRAIRPPQFRRLRQSDKQRRFGKRKLPRLLAEIDERGGADALDIAAIGREIEIERENFVLGQRALDLDGAHASGGACPADRARARPSSRRATCMVSVEAPERMRPLVANCNVARPTASGSTP